MAFNTAEGRATYTASSSQTEFTFTFKVFTTADIKVYQTTSGSLPNDTTDLLSITTDYTVSINGDNGGTITLVNGATTGDVITLVRDLDIKRDVDYQDNGDLLASTLDSDQNYQTYLIQQMSSISDRTIRLQDTTDASAIIPAPQSGYLFRWNLSGDGIDAIDPYSLLDNPTSVMIGTISSLRLTPYVGQQIVSVTGYYTSSDNIGVREYYWDATSTEADNGGTIIQVTGVVTGRWQMKYSGAVNVDWFGVVGDNSTLNSVAMQKCIDYAIANKIEIGVPSGNYIFETTLVMYAGLTIKGKGGAIQQGVTFKVNSNIAMFDTGTATFAAESMEFCNINFSSVTAGQGTAFYAPSTVFISQTTFRNCAWSSNLLYGINAPIILCKFYDCDFGTYPGTVQNFIGINAVGTLSTREPNANTFYSCVFRRSNALHMINIATGGVQWLFIACDFEQNACAQEVIRNDGAGSLTFLNGYSEGNTTPYFVRCYGVLISYFTNVVSFKNMHFNNPCTDSILKREIIYPVLDITGCYGQLNCNLLKNELNVLNDANDVALSVGNHFNVGTGSTGDIATLTGVVTAYHTGNFQAKQPIVPSFSAYSNAAQAISATTWTKVNFLTVLSESAHNYYDQANAKFVPQKSGKYLITASQSIVTATATAFLELAIYKNGVLYRVLNVGYTNGGYYPWARGSCVIDANGTTDYFEVYVYSNGAYNLISGATNSEFSGYYIGV